MYVLAVDGGVPTWYLSAYNCFCLDENYYLTLHKKVC